MDQCIIIIKKVPTEICLKCGQKSYGDEVARQIETIVNSMKNSITEIAVVQYFDKNVA